MQEGGSSSKLGGQEFPIRVDHSIIGWLCVYAVYTACRHKVGRLNVLYDGTVGGRDFDRNSSFALTVQLGGAKICGQATHDQP